jgi:hypothetical protein
MLRKLENYIRKMKSITGIFICKDRFRPRWEHFVHIFPSMERTQESWAFRTRKWRHKTSCSVCDCIIKNRIGEVAIKEEKNGEQALIKKIWDKTKSKAIPVAGRGGLQGCKMLRIPHCLDNRLTNGGKVVSPTHRPLLYSPETLFLCFWYSFLLGLVKPQGLVRPEGLGKLIKIVHLLGSRTRDLPVCNIAP